MNCIQGIHEEQYQGVRVRYETKQGMLSIGKGDHTSFSILTEPGTSIVSTDRLVLNTNQICVPSWSGAILPTYVSIDISGNLVQTTQYGYALVMAISVVWFVSRWL